MARIRTIKPEFWDDEKVGALEPLARLLFIATWNAADDEGLLRWTVPYLKSLAFVYDDDVSVKRVADLMGQIEREKLVVAYVAGAARQQLGWVVNFRKHQRINRPQPSKLPPPAITNPEIKEWYAQRDGWICGICNERIPDPAAARDHPSRVAALSEPLLLSLDHILPRVKGGTDHPSNIRATHCGCNKARAAGNNAGMPKSVEYALNDSRNRSMNDSLNDSVNDSLKNAFTESFSEHSLLEGKGREEDKEEEGKGRGKEIKEKDDVARENSDNGRQQTANDQQLQNTAQSNMADLVDDFVAANVTEKVQRQKFVSLAAGIVDGSDYALWQDKTGTQIAWKDRARLLKLALNQCKANPQQSLRSALRYVIPQQLDPFPTRAVDKSEIPEGSEAAKYQSRAADRAASSRQDTTNKRVARLEPADGPQPIEVDDLAKWEAEHAGEGRELKKQIEQQFQQDPQWATAGDTPLSRIALKSRYMAAVAEQVRAARAKTLAPESTIK